MANTNQPVRACVLKVDVKCCSGCQNKASTKLQSLPGVSTAEYNAKKGLMTVTGDVDPMTLVQKLTRWGRKAELVSVSYMRDDLISDDEDEDDDEDTSSDDTSSDSDPEPMKRVTQANMTTTMKNKKEGMLRKYRLLGCLSSKSKVVQPSPLAKRMFGSTKFGNGSDYGGYGNPLANAITMPRQPPPAFHGPMNPQQQYQTMMQQPRPQLQMNGAPMYAMQRSAQPEKPPYHMQMYPQFRAPPMTMVPQPAKINPQMTVNNILHYPN